jgi:hypothetical protein
MKRHINTTKHEETLKKNESELNIEKLNEKLELELKTIYDEKKNKEKIKKEKEKKMMKKE